MIHAKHNLKVFGEQFRRSVEGKLPTEKIDNIIAALNGAKISYTAAGVVVVGALLHAPMACEVELYKLGSGATEIYRVEEGDSDGFRA